MKALIWKELRQMAPRDALLLLAGVAFMLSVLITDNDFRFRVQFLNNGLPFFLLVIGMVSAIVLGLQQTVLEARRDTWAFLMHRGVSPTRVFLAKCLAGACVYFCIELILAVAGIAWCRRGGVEQYPFAWSQTLMLPIAACIPVGFYFAAMLAAVWQGPWKISRVFPLVAAWLAMLGALMLITEQKNSYFLAGLYCVAVAGVLGVAACGVFVRSGESSGRSEIANVCLGVPIFATILAAFLILFAVGESLHQWYRDQKEPNPSDWSHLHVKLYSINRQGHVGLLESRPGAASTKPELVIQSFTDLDDPNSRQFESLVGKPVGTVFQSSPSRSVWENLSMTSIISSEDSWLSTILLRNSRGESAELRDLEPARSVRDIYWLYSAADGWIYGYIEVPEFRDGIRIDKQPRLVAVVGPDGFVGGSQGPQRRFGKLLVNTSPMGAQATSVWLDLDRGALGNSRTSYLLFDDGLYAMDFSARTVERLLVSSEGRKIRDVAKLKDALAVVYDDMIAVHAIKTVTLPAPPSDGKNKPEPVSIRLPGEFQYSFPLPREIAGYRVISFGRLPDQDVVVFHAGNMSETLSSGRIVHMKLDGTIMRRLDYRDTGFLPPRDLPAVCATAFFLPAAPLLLASVTHVVDPLASPGDTGVISRPIVELLIIRPPLAWGIMIAMALLCGWLAYRTARKYGFESRTRVVWVAVAMCFGPAGLLTLWFLRDWPVLEACPVCTRRRPVDRDACPQCGAVIPSPATNGSEVVIHSSEPALTQAV